MEVTTTKDHQLHLMIDTPTAHIWREQVDLTEPNLTTPS
jgi:hypothetical protein